MIKRLIQGMTLLLAFCMLAPAQAETYPATPYQVIKVAADKTFQDIDQHQDKIKNNVGVLRTIIRNDLMPYVDYKYAAYFVVGAQLRGTTKDERENFANAFRDYIIETYANALSKYYSNQTVKVLEPKQPNNGKIAMVEVEVHQGDQAPIELQFTLRKNKRTGQWKAFDMVAEGGISLLTTQKSELAPLLREKGIVAVTKTLVERQKALANGKASDSKASA
ncbi:MlaC/ttg2D family ABC transporter substrate-binding protein [Dongshaea marina]|uniref:MlaC/ttg2D family ABC transporter substrate-binding protein n=1 Tax=Dongshaea marina TaxID=2047966 RepID=UPI001F25618C|nr:ABC transporter substrate-binding protein [Dongshaea marina]